MALKVFQKLFSTHFIHFLFASSEIIFSLILKNANRIFFSVIGQCSPFVDPSLAAGELSQIYSFYSITGGFLYTFSGSLKRVTERNFQN
jgi:hypothetical protein